MVRTPSLSYIAKCNVEVFLAFFENWKNLCIVELDDIDNERTTVQQFIYMETATKY